MRLTGYRRTCGRCNGGIRSVALVGADAVAGVERDPATGGYTAITLAEGAAFALYRFREDQAEYTETVSTDEGPVLVEHALEMMLERMDGASARAVQELCGAGGVVALVTTNSGVTLLVGYSDRFGARYPLRLNRSSGESGRRPTDDTAERVVLRSADTAKARVFTGELPV